MTIPHDANNANNATSEARLARHGAPRRPRCRSIAIAVGLAAPMLALAPLAPAQSEGPAADQSSRTNEAAEVDAPASIAQLLDQLDAASYVDRQAAMFALMDRRDALPELREALDRGDLSLEQQYRVLLVVEHLIVATPRGAVGIRVNLQRRPEIVISDLVPGLPAEKVLRIDDQITHVDGMALDRWERFVEAVQYKSPGERITLTVRRPIRGPWREREEPGGAVRPIDEEAGLEGPGEDAAAGDDGGANELTMQTLQISLVLGSADDLIDPATGQAQDGGLVLLRRRAQAADVRDAHLPQPRVVKLAGEKLERFVAEHSPTASDSVEQAAAIRKLRLQQALIEQGQLEINGALRSMWDHELRILREAAAHPHLSEADRAYLERVADEYDKITRALGR